MNRNSNHNSRIYTITHIGKIERRAGLYADAGAVYVFSCFEFFTIVEMYVQDGYRYANQREGGGGGGVVAGSAIDRGAEGAGAIPIQKARTPR